MKILVTGANGLLGRETLKSLKKYHEVHAIVHNLPQDKLNNVTYYEIDLSSDWSTGVLPASIDTVIHLAQSSHFRNFPEKALNVFRVNTESTARLLDYARISEAKRFIFASSGGIYGKGEKAFDENSPIIPHGELGYYLGSKLCSEILVQNYASIMDVIILRFFFIYGPRQNRSMLIPRLVDNVKSGRPIVLEGDHGIRINPIFVVDAAKALTEVLKLNDSYTINIAGPQDVSLREIGDAIGELLNREPVYEKRGNEPPRDIVANIETMRSKLSEPETTPFEGLKKLIDGLN